MILIIDNYDSFTWNLVQRLGELDRSLQLDRDLLVVRNDRITPDQARALDAGRGPSHVIVSPGPCTPNEAGVSCDIIETFAGVVPILGVCLGHQCIGDRFGMRVVRNVEPVHGKTAQIEHDGLGLFAGVPSPFTAARYHSLIVADDSVPKPARGQDGWHVSAWVDETADDGSRRRIVMGLRRLWTDDSRAPLEGVQFHPESFLTDEGPKLLANFLAMGNETATAGRERS